MSEYIEFIKINARRAYDPETHTSKLISIENIEPSDPVFEMYEDAYESYKEMYNSTMARGKSKLEPRTMDGKPIQLDLDNFNSLLLHDMFTSLKLKGERMLMMFSNGFSKKLHIVGRETKYRNIYFIDTALNFWYVKQHNPKSHNIQEKQLLTSEHITLTNIDKCLIDGELVMWGLIEKTFDKNDSVIKYTLKNDGQIRPFIALIGFDMLHGPTFPQFPHEKDPSSTADIFKLDFGSVGAMLGFKGADRWPTTDRRYVLENMFDSKFSHILKYLKELTDNKINFTILVQPFFSINDVFKHKDILKFVNDSCIADLNRQFLRNTGHNIQKVERTLNFDHETFIKNKKYGAENTYEEWYINEKRTKMIGHGLDNDGLIFTPKHLPYLSGTWSFCSNKQYKWKPKNSLTIDFEVGPLVKLDNSDEIFREALIRSYKGTKGLQQFAFASGLNKCEPNKALIRVKDKIINSIILKKKKVIVETIYTETTDDMLIFDIENIRFDKSKPNSEQTAISVMNAMNAKADILDIVRSLKINGDKEPSKDILELILKELSKESLYKMALTMSVKEPLSVVTGVNGPVLKPLSPYPNKVLGPCSILSSNKKNEIIEMIKKVRESPGLELEGQITFKTERDKKGHIIYKAERNKSVVTCLINNTILSRYKTVPMIRMITSEKNEDEDAEISDTKKERFRTTYINLGNSLLVENVDKKTSLNLVEIDFNIKDNCDQDIELYPDINKIRTVLSSEEKVNTNRSIDILLENDKLSSDDIKIVLENLDTILKINGIKNQTIKNQIQNKPDKLQHILGLNKKVKWIYQNRYIISNLSLFWSVEIIEQGSSKISWSAAFDKFNSGADTGSSETRIELEYRPALYYTELLLFYKENPNETSLNTLLETLNLQKEEFRQLNADETYSKLDLYIKNLINKLNKIDPIYVLEDYMALIIKILNIFYY